MRNRGGADGDGDSVVVVGSSALTASIVAAAAAEEYVRTKGAATAVEPLCTRIVLCRWWWRWRWRKDGCRRAGAPGCGTRAAEANRIHEVAEEGRHPLCHDNRGSTIKRVVMMRIAAESGSGGRDGLQ